jgi:DNA-binding transcriptional LysR family regulator
MLRSERFILREEGAGTRALSDRFFAQNGFVPRISMVTSSNEMIKQAVIAGMGVALLSYHTIGLERGLGLLVALPVEGLPVMRSWYVVHRRNMPLLPLQSRLHDFLVERGQAIIEELGVSHRDYGGRQAQEIPWSGVPSDIDKPDLIRV